MSKTRFAIPVVLALAAALGTGVAHARDADVQWSVTIGTPVHVRTQPVYDAPVYQQPAPVYRQHRPGYSHSRYQAPTHWDRDGDGIPNRRDARYSPHWDRDGDGLPNRYDRRDHNPWRR